MGNDVLDAFDYLLGELKKVSADLRQQGTEAFQNDDLDAALQSAEKAKQIEGLSLRP